MQELAYRPNRNARSLAGRSMNTLAIAAPSFACAPSNQLLGGALISLRGRKGDLLVWEVGAEDFLVSLKERLEPGIVDGLILATPSMNDRVAEELRLLQTPVVLVGNRHDQFDSLWWEAAECAQVAVRHLVNQGHRNIGFVLPDAEERKPSSRAYLNGYRRALEEAGVSFDEELIVWVDDQDDGAGTTPTLEPTVRLLLSRLPVTAFIVADTKIVLSIQKKVLQKDIRVPSNFTLISCDNSELSHLLGLSRVRYKLARVGEKAVELIFRRLVGDEQDVPLVSKKIAPSVMC